MKRALLVGRPTDVHAVRKLVNRNSGTWRVTTQSLAALKLPLVDAVVAIGGPRPDPVVASYAHRMRKPIGIIWTGPDLALIDRGYDAAARVRARRYQHAALSFRIARDLRRLGIDSDVLSLDDDVRQLERFFDRVSSFRIEGKHRAVVSGSSQRVAAFIEEAHRTMHDWDFHAAISGSRAERIDDVVSLITAKRWYRLGGRREDRLFRYAARLFLKRRFRGSSMPHETNEVNFISAEYAKPYR